MKYVFLTYCCYPMPIAKHLVDEGNEVMVGIIHSRDQLNIPGVKDEEEPKDRKERLSNYDGVLDKRPHTEILKELEKVADEDKDDYFFFFDFNDTYKISEQVLKMGFSVGLFPTEKYYNLEKERELAKLFVKKYYPGLKVADSFKFEKVDEGIAHIEENPEEIFVLKSNGNSGKTIVPFSDDPEVAGRQITSALEKCKTEYEQGGFMLEKKIVGAMEVTPVMVFFDGEPIYSLVEFENKQFGAGNIGAQKGGGQAVSIKTDLEAKINKIAFPDIVYKMAKKQPGMSIFDAGLLFDGEDFYFTEFCAMRFGWDGIFSEMVMRDDGGPFVTKYFEDIVAGEDPIKRKFGVSVRLFNYEGDLEDTDDPVGGEAMEWDHVIDDYLFLYNCRLDKDERTVCTADNDFIGAICGAGDTLEEAVEVTYDRIRLFNFEKLYYRYEGDFLATDYETSIRSRIASIKPYLRVEKEKDDSV